MLMMPLDEYPRDCKALSLIPQVRSILRDGRETLRYCFPKIQ
jgi:hypothetical protein